MTFAYDVHRDVYVSLEGLRMRGNCSREIARLASLQDKVSHILLFLNFKLTNSTRRLLDFGIQCTP